MMKPKNPNFDISSGLATRTTDDQRNDLAGSLAAEAMAQVGPGYILAAQVLVQAAASVLVTRMPPDLAATLIADLGTMNADNIRTNFCAPGGARQ
ncbi:hypothetical protein NZL82_13855 [Sphingomonas sanguinis]|jgi:hypothetical protein|uniref:hypothetical protein n=1 Tax=Sphingomonas sp. LC-1 TaxID=3110957 RepID=UPI0021BA629D|nr:hypothetical protein [Sphingomonas sp. LC-1]MCT8002961.1 hypothetical protein [Sphingomonas sp. LC-1]